MPALADRESGPRITHAFDCDDGSVFAVAALPGAVGLWPPGELGGYRELPAVASASGAQFRRDDAVFWNKGDLATIEIDGRRFVDCLSNPSRVPWADAARRGASFRAVGNEPGWYLEVFPDLLVLVAFYGERRVVAPYAATERDGASRVYRATDANVAVRIEPGRCVDDMSGAGFETVVTVEFEGNVLRGCGRDL